MWGNAWDGDLMCAGAVVGSVALLSVIAKSIGPVRAPSEAPTKGRALLQQSLEWLRLSENDAVPLFAYRHCAFALAYMNAARLVAPDRELQRHGTDVHKLASTLEARLVSLSRKISKTCAPSNPNATKTTSISWI